MVALGLAQATGLTEVLPRLRRTRWVLVTAAVAGLGRAVGALPSVLSGGATGTEPPRGLVLLGAAGIGLGMGAVLGTAQSLLLSGLVPVPSRWVLVNAVAWPPAMAVIFLGASTPDAAWPSAVGPADRRAHRCGRRGGARRGQRPAAALGWGQISGSRPSCFARRRRRQ